MQFILCTLRTKFDTFSEDSDRFDKVVIIFPCTSLPSILNQMRIPELWTALLRFLNYTIYMLMSMGNVNIRVKIQAKLDFSLQKFHENPALLK